MATDTSLSVQASRVTCCRVHGNIDFPEFRSLVFPVCIPQWVLVDHSLYVLSVIRAYSIVNTPETKVVD